MNPTYRVHGAYVSLASVLTMGIVATTHGCTTEINNTSDAGGSSSSSSGSSSGGGSSSSSSSGSSSSGGSSGSSSGGTITCSPPGATTIPVEAGAALIPVSSAHAQGDASPPWNVQWGSFSPFGAGTYLYPADSTGAPAAPGSIADSIANPDAGTYCTTLGSQNTFSATYSLAMNAWNLTGTIATYSGVGIYLVPCFDASSFSGVEFTVQGDVGDEQVSDAGDGGTTGGLMQFVAAQASDNMVNTTGTAGTCASACNPAAMNFPVSSTPQTITIRWTDLTGGTPTPTLDTPTQIVRIGWQYIWPCAINPTPFQTNVTISNIHLVP